MGFINTKKGRVDVGEMDLDVRRKEDEEKKRRLMAMMDEKRSNGEKIKKEDELEDFSEIDSAVGKRVEMDVPLSRLVRIDDIYPEWDVFPAAPDDKIIDLAQSIDAYGLLHRITLWELGDGRYLILGGHTRTAAFEFLHDWYNEKFNEEKYDIIPSLVYKKEQIDETDAHRIFLLSNTNQRENSPFVLGRAYNDLMKLENKKAFYGSGIYAKESVAKQTGVKPSNLYRYISLYKTGYKPLVDAVSRKEISFNVAYTLSRMPKNLQMFVYNSGKYVKMSMNKAKVLSTAMTEADVKRELDDYENGPKSFEYKVISRTARPKNYEIIPVFVRPEKKDELVQLIAELVKKSEPKENIIVG